MPDLEIVPLTPDRLPDLATLFGEGGDPKWCWCAFFRVRSIDFRTATAEGNRAVLERATVTTASQGRAPGLIAYRAGEPIGWVSLGPRDDYERLQNSRVLAPLDDRPVWSIVCFAVSAAARGRGVAKALLDGAIAYARERGAEALEAYPVVVDAGEGIHPDSAFTGTLPMFERAGFSVVAERASDPSASRVRVVVRRELE